MTSKTQVSADFKQEPTLNWIKPETVLVKSKNEMKFVTVAHFFINYVSSRPWSLGRCLYWLSAYCVTLRTWVWILSTHIKAAHSSMFLQSKTRDHINILTIFIIVWEIGLQEKKDKLCRPAEVWKHWNLKRKSFTQLSFITQVKPFKLPFPESTVQPRACS